MIRKECPNCKSKNLSDGKNDYIYYPETSEEVLIQFCNNCHEEWFVKEDTGVKK